MGAPLLKFVFANTNTISVRSDFWCPYNCKSNTDLPGYMIEILKVAFGKENVDYQELNWTRSLKDAGEGKFDAVVGVNKDGAPGFIYSKYMLGKSAMCYYTKTSSKWKFHNLNSLANQTLGVIQSYTYYDELDTYIKTYENQPNKVQTHAGNDALIRMLQKLQLNRLSVIIEDPNVMGYALKYYPKFTDIQEAGCGVGEPLYIAFSPANPQSPQRAQQLDEAFFKMKKNGSLKKLLKKYNIKPWQE